MSLNLLDAIKNEVSSTVIDKISNYLGESRGNTSNAITAAIPAILAFFSEKSRTESGASSLINLATDSNLLNLFSGNSFTDVFEKNRDSLMSKGNSMLIDLFGDKEAKLSQEISNYANIGKESSDGILASILPLIMSVLGNRISGDGLNASSLLGLFDNQRDSIFSAIPAGLAGLGGVLGLSNWGDRVADQVAATTTRVTDTVRDAVDTTRTHVREEKEHFDNNNDNGGGFMKWLLPLLGIIAALALLWFLMQKCNDDKKVTEPATTTQTHDVEMDHDATVTAPAANIRGEYDEANNRFVYDRGADREITFPDGTSIIVGDNSTEWKLFDFISNDANTVSDDKTQGWITLDRVYFETGSNKLTAESKAQLDNIAAIMKAYPNAKAKFGGYTDNAGSDDINVPLSNDRAIAVMNDVVNTGIDAARVEAEGYGAQHFVCPANDTPACMAQNRRVDIRVTSK
ncbi:MAG: OmpA family protein [Flavobacteriaceae bacterium]|nr:OmpA family protein [Flavobacteriaceae bacterium]